MAVNPNGYTPVTDGGTPRIITGYAKEVISGGQFVGCSGAAGVVGSGRDSFVATDIEFYLTAGSGNFVGVAMANVASGATMSAARRGDFLVSVSGTIVTAGTKVGCNDKSDVIFIGSHTSAGHTGLNAIGRTLTTGSTSDFVVLELGY